MKPIPTIEVYDLTIGTWATIRTDAIIAVDRTKDEDRIVVCLISGRELPCVFSYRIMMQKLGWKINE